MPLSNTPIILPVHSLKRRASFLAVAASGKKWVAPGFILQLAPLDHAGLKEPERASPALHYGLTATKKIGNAVIRNRARRRLRELVRLILACHADPGYVYVLVARETAVKLNFQLLRDDLTKALHKMRVWRDA